jgi:hypothetical protein
MLPVTMWVKPPAAIKEVIKAITANFAFSAAGIIHTIAATMKPELTPANIMPGQFMCVRWRLTSTMLASNSGFSTGV